MKLKITHITICTIAFLFGVVIGRYIALLWFADFDFKQLPDAYHGFIQAMLAGGMTVFAGWLAFKEAHKSNEIQNRELRQKNLRVLYLDSCSFLKGQEKLKSITEKVYNEYYRSLISKLDEKPVFKKFADDIREAMIQSATTTGHIPYFQREESLKTVAQWNEIIDSYGQRSFDLGTNPNRDDFIAGFFNSNDLVKAVSYKSFYKQIEKSHTEAFNLHEDYATKLADTTQDFTCNK